MAFPLSAQITLVKKHKPVARICVTGQAEADKQAAEQDAQAEKEAQEAKAREIATSQQKIARIRRETEMLNQQ